jgi:hypothetical protein
MTPESTMAVQLTEQSGGWVLEVQLTGMALFCKPFTQACIRHFGESNCDRARAWLEDPLREADSAHATGPGSGKEEGLR